MQLIELLSLAPEWDDDEATIYVVQPWACDADAVLVSPAPPATEPVEQAARRYDYFLETFIAREFIEGYATSAEGADASPGQRCERLIRYARDDA